MIGNYENSNYCFNFENSIFQKQGFISIKKNSFPKKCGVGSSQVRTSGRAHIKIRSEILNFFLVFSTGRKF